MIVPTKIIMVDDDIAVTSYYQKTIQRMWPTCQILTFNYAQKAIEFLSAEKFEPDLMYVDINMPTIDGWSFLDKYKRMRKRKSRTKVFMVSRSLHTEDKNRAEAYKFVEGYICKPMTREQIMSTAS